MYSYIEPQHNSQEFRDLCNLVIELEDRKLIRCMAYPYDIAEYVIQRGLPCLDKWQPTHTWSIYKTMANGFSWKGRSHAY